MTIKETFTVNNKFLLLSFVILKNCTIYSVSGEIFMHNWDGKSNCIVSNLSLVTTICFFDWYEIKVFFL